MYNLPKPRKRKHISIGEIKTQLPQSLLHMYETLPELEEIVIDEFEDLAVERCLLLRFIENATQRGLKVDTEEWRCYIVESVRTHGLTTYFVFFDLPNGRSEKEAIKYDLLSHYILRLAYCKNVDLRKRFCHLEQQLFSLKFSYLSEEAKTALYETYCQPFMPASLYKILFFHYIDDCSPENLDVSKTEFYEVPFYKASKSLSERSVYLYKGNVYLPRFKLIESLEYDLGEQIKKGLTEILNCLEYVERDERIKNILENLETLAIVKQKTFKSPDCNQELRLEELDRYAQDNYPLCMYTLHKTLTTKHHLKHDARLQYGRFLKDAGFECDEVHAIYREHFCKEITEKQFMKKYSYGIKYMYGLSGRKRQQEAYNCAKILAKDVVCYGEYGCPYKHWDQTKLRQVLTEKSLLLRDIEDIVRLKENEQYQLACTKCFDCTHSGNYSKVVEHPNEYFEESRGRTGLIELSRMRALDLDEAEENDLQI